MILKYEHLLGHKFDHGKRDCYSVVKDMYKDNAGIELPAPARPDDWWLDDTMNLYMDNYEAAGFFLVEGNFFTDLRPLDVLLVAMPDMRKPNRSVANHAMVYIGDGDIIHHRLGKLSQKTRLRKDLWGPMIVARIRHKDTPPMLTQNKPPIDILGRMLPEKRALLEDLVNGKIK
jgi:cell wall-associated NlpC family hydrolase